MEIKVNNNISNDYIAKFIPYNNQGFLNIPEVYLFHVVIHYIETFSIYY